MGARYYDPTLGRFLSEDPVFVTVGNVKNEEDRKRLEALLSDPQQLNAYARNNPIAYVDPDGRLAVPASIYTAVLKAGDWGNRAYASNGVARAAMDHPYLPAAIGAAPLVVYEATIVAPSIPSAVSAAASQVGTVGAIRAALGASLNVAGTALTDKADGRSASAGEYAVSAAAGAGQALVPGGWKALAAGAGVANGVQQLVSTGRIDPMSSMIAAGSAFASGGLLNAPALTSVPQLQRVVTEPVLNWVIETPAQISNDAIRAKEAKRKRGN